MAKRNVESVNDTNYSITDRNRPVKKKRRIFGTILALLLSLVLALFMRYYVEVSVHREAENKKEDSTQVAEISGENPIL
ncbi:MAG: hypothetical protein E7599_08050 [Ruminococcaceae bacterium]|nr:hypothetical protein [Oscillospiraceae bacterium]